MMDTTHRDAAFWAADYADYLRDLVGATDTTQARNLPTVRRSITAYSGPDAPDWTGLSVQQVTEFICGRLGKGQGTGARCLRAQRVPYTPLSQFPHNSLRHLAFGAV